MYLKELTHQSLYLCIVKFILGVDEPGQVMLHTGNISNNTFKFK